MIRPARESDYEVWCTLMAELGVDDPVPTFERWSTALMPKTHVAERDGEVIGYIDCYTLDETGYVRNLVVARSARNAGVGAALMRLGADWLRAQGMARWNLNVKADNAPAIHLYEKLGLRTIYRSTALRMTWEQIGTLPAEPADAMPVEEADTRPLEQHFELLAGRIAQGRLKPGRVVLQLRAADRAVGAIVFDPAFPGANVIRVIRPALIGTLLAALRPHARHDFINLLIERDDPLSDLLEAHGATVKFRLFQMSGELPVSSAHGG